MSAHTDLDIQKYNYLDSHDQARAKKSVSFHVVLLEGWLEKKSPKSVMGVHPWQRRYFTLTTDDLIYGETEEMDSEKGMICRLAHPHGRYCVREQS